MRVTAIQETSMMAYCVHKENGQQSRQQMSVISVLENAGCDMSIGEIAVELGLEKSSVSARVNELIAKEQLVVAPRRTDKISGRLVRPVRLAPVQMELGHGG